jgi:hypothetical protein
MKTTIHRHAMIAPLVFAALIGPGLSVLPNARAQMSPDQAMQRLRAAERQADDLPGAADDLPVYRFDDLPATVQRQLAQAAETCVEVDGVLWFGLTLDRAAAVAKSGRDAEAFLQPNAPLLYDPAGDRSATSIETAVAATAGGVYVGKRSVLAVGRHGLLIRVDDERWFVRTDTAGWAVGDVFDAPLRRAETLELADAAGAMIRLPVYQPVDVAPVRPTAAALGRYLVAHDLRGPAYHLPRRVDGGERSARAGGHALRYTVVDRRGVRTPLLTEPVRDGRMSVYHYEWDLRWKPMPLAGVYRLAD